MEVVLKSVFVLLSVEQCVDVVGIGVDSIGLILVFVDVEGNVLVLCEEFVDNFNVMFVLWKDYIVVEEVEVIICLCYQLGKEDYLCYIGGIYFSEWFWVKIFYVICEDSVVVQVVVLWVEFCDWVFVLFFGIMCLQDLCCGCCSVGYKLLWYESWGGLLLVSFFDEFDFIINQYLVWLLFIDIWMVDVLVGMLSVEWVQCLGLLQSVVIFGGVFDCYMGVVGVGVQFNVLVKVIGIFICDILIVDKESVGECMVKGICGQVDGSVVLYFIGMEVGQFVFGDIYVWFGCIFGWLLEQLVQQQLVLCE